MQLIQTLSKLHSSSQKHTALLLRLRHTILSERGKPKGFAERLGTEGCADIPHMLIGIFYYCKYCSVKSGIYRQLVHLTKIVICLASETL